MLFQLSYIHVTVYDLVGANNQQMNNLGKTPPDHCETLLATIETVTGGDEEDKSANSNR